MSLSWAFACERRRHDVAPLPRAKSLHGMETFWTAREIVLEPVAPPPETHVDARTFVEALREEVGAWNAALRDCSDAPRLVVGALRGHGAARDDGHNVVVLLGATWCPADRRGIEPCYDPEAQAITQIRTRDDYPGPRGGEIREADVEINGVNFRWSSQGRSTGSRSLRAILGHELGHVLGLAHPCSASASAGQNDTSLDCRLTDSRSIMYPDPTEPGRAAVLTPGADAVATLCARLTSDREAVDSAK